MLMNPNGAGLKIYFSWAGETTGYFLEYLGAQARMSPNLIKPCLGLNKICAD